MFQSAVSRSHSCDNNTLRNGISGDYRRDILVPHGVLDDLYGLIVLKVPEWQRKA
ncbi:MAG: hypothetical protein HY795_14345 [Desulfovibrio sp.]|nr:hypothetical protein [Desulfovibrio sp.]MBI4959531.1 hypothetical protein [Desulfovibrio sp.]